MSGGFSNNICTKAEERKSHHLWLTGLNTLQARNLLAARISHIRNNGDEATPDVEKNTHGATEQAWTNYENDEIPPYPRPIIYVPPNALL
jgi:hypothetical protein